MCEDCLSSIVQDPQSQFVPDFTARAVENARIMRISRKRFYQASFHGGVENGEPPVFEEVEMAHIQDVQLDSQSGSLLQPCMKINTAVVI
eukprot:TRINITY_DN2925_c0_g1_i1.p1 TRINITY_DN2925_c0_g1~~TRINITY_DN2925_c0_g1_i1.p1  ORF type:complete len:90 (+),score=7.14 TRINITY_DN2925_c0_g1_i1:546-815(+)